MSWTSPGPWRAGSRSCSSASPSATPQRPAPSSTSSWPAASDVVEEAYGNTTILSDPLGGTALALAGDWILLAPSVDLVKAGIDVLSGEAPSLAEDADFSTAWARVPAAHIVAAYMDFESLAPLMDLATQAAAGETGMTIDLEGLSEQLPTDMVAYLVAEGDRMTLEAFITPSEQTPGMAVGESDLAARFPADTQLYVETRELGATLATTIGGLLATMDEQAAAEMAPLEDMFGVPLPELLDFVSDASVGASLSSDGLWLGIAAEVTDEELARTAWSASSPSSGSWEPAWAARMPRRSASMRPSSATRM